MNLDIFLFFSTDNYLCYLRYSHKSELRFFKLIRKKIRNSATIPRNTEMRKMIKNQERVIEEMMLEILNTTIENEKVSDVGEVVIG